MSTKRWAVGLVFVAAVLTAASGAQARTSRPVDELMLMDANELLVEAVFACGMTSITGTEGGWYGYLDRVALVARAHLRRKNPAAPYPDWYKPLSEVQLSAESKKCGALYEKYKGKEAK